ncbi:hypothetical protein [Peribacillus kribbensis]|nr:hypothetical protein [Peribacillus kribbensis]
MMIGMPFLAAVIPGFLVLLLTLRLTKRFSFICKAFAKYVDCLYVYCIVL